ncbi:hypothetical protein D3C78_1412130 [compost metagenome]
MRVDPLTQAYQFPKHGIQQPLLIVDRLGACRPVSAPPREDNRAAESALTVRGKMALVEVHREGIPHRLGHQSELALNRLTGNQGLAMQAEPLLDDVG